MTTATATNTKATYTIEEKINWLEYKQGVSLNPLLKQYAEESVDKCYLIKAEALMGLNTPAFIAYLERIMAISYGMGIEYEKVIYPPIPAQWVKGLSRAIIDWAINLAYVNGMLDN